MVAGRGCWTMELPSWVALDMSEISCQTTGYCFQLDVPTPANLSGATECTTAEQVREQLRDRIALIVDGGPSPRTTSSTIVHFREDGTWQILREGAIPAKDIVEALS